MSVTTNLGRVTAYADAVNAGYTGTREQFAADQAAFAANATAVATAKAAAEAAQAAAEAAKTNAETAESNAVTAKNGAESAKTSAETAKTGAETAKTNAETAQAAASASASAAAGSATTASTKASEAASSASAAAASALAAAASEANAATVAEETAQAVVDNKLDIDGYSALARVGTADNLAGKGDGVNASYIHRTTGGSADVADGAATVKSIKGNTIVWNQLVNPTKTTTTYNGIMLTNNGDGTFTITGTATGDVPFLMPGIPIIGRSNHKFILQGAPSTSTTDTYYMGDHNKGTPSYDIGNGAIFYPTVTLVATIYVKSGTVLPANGVVFKPQCFDLTQMFGAGNEPTSVAEFKALFPKDYYAYDIGSLLSFVGNGIKTVGFNLFDEETKLMAITGTTKVGAYYSFTADKWHDAFYRTSLIAVPTEYTGQIEIRLNAYASNTTAIPQFVFKYSDGTVSYGLFARTTTPTDYTFISTEGKRVVAVNGTYYDNGTVYIKDFCIHLAWSGYRNGEYEEYWTQTRNLPTATYFPNGMRSAGDVYDELTANKAITRIGSRAYVSGDESDSTVITDGTNTYYALATPTEVAISPELNLSYLVSDFGTEKITTADNAPTAPCNMDVVYGLNAVDAIRRLPENYVATTEQTLTATQKTQILANLGISDMAHIVSAPSSASATGTGGNIAYDDNYLYICTASNVWKRVAIATW